MGVNRNSNGTLKRIHERKDMVEIDLLVINAAMLLMNRLAADKRPSGPRT